MSPDEIILALKKIKQVLDVANRDCENSSDYEKEMYVHRYMVENVTYELSEDLPVHKAHSVVTVFQRQQKYYWIVLEFNLLLYRVTHRILILQVQEVGMHGIWFGLKANHTMWILHLTIIYLIKRSL